MRKKTNPVYNKRIGRNIRYERNKRNISSAELAKMMGLSISHINLVERGKRGMMLQHLINITELFGITLNNLIYDNHDDTDNMIPDIGSLSSYKTTMNALMYDMSEYELDFLIKTVRNLKSLRKNDIL